MNRVSIIYKSNIALRFMEFPNSLENSNWLSISTDLLFIYQLIPSVYFYIITTIDQAPLVYV